MGKGNEKEKKENNINERQAVSFALCPFSFFCVFGLGRTPVGIISAHPVFRLGMRETRLIFCCSNSHTIHQILTLATHARNRGEGMDGCEGGTRILVTLGGECHTTPRLIGPRIHFPALRHACGTAYIYVYVCMFTRARGKKKPHPCREPQAAAPNSKGDPSLLNPPSYPDQREAHSVSLSLTLSTMHEEYNQRHEKGLFTWLPAPWPWRPAVPPPPWSGAWPALTCTC